MQYLGGKLSAAQLQVAGWVGSFRRSVQGALELVWGPSDDKQEVEEEEEEDVGDRGDVDGGDESGRFQRAMSPLRSFARRSRRSLRRFSGRSQDPFQKRATTTCCVNSYSLNDEDEPTETLFPNELPQQDGISEPTSKPDSPTPVADQVPDVTSDDDNNTDSPRELDLASFPEISTPLLDTSSQRSKAVLSRRRRRTLPSRSIRLGSIKAPRVEPRVYHGEKKNESDSEEELPKSKPILTPPTSTSKVAMFPGLSSADLLAGIKRKTVGRAAEDESAEERGGKEKESQNKEVAPSHISGSPRLPTPLPGAARVLPRAGGKEGSSFKSPPWLKELKSKKRMNQNIGEN